MKISNDTSAQFAQPPPPGWDTLVDVSARLEKSRIVHALGGTGLLHCLGFPVQPRDWDLRTDARREASLCKALAGYEIRMRGPSPLYPSDYLLQIRAESTVIELIGSFAIALHDRVIRIPTRVWRYHRGVPLGHPGIDDGCPVTDSGRILVVIHTLRDDRVRIISARKASRNEARSYHA